MASNFFPRTNLKVVQAPPPRIVSPKPTLANPLDDTNFTPAGGQIVTLRNVTTNPTAPGTIDRVRTDDGSPITPVRFVDSAGNVTGGFPLDNSAGHYNAADFGLAPGNADNLALIVAAMAAISASGGGTLHFAAGTYKFLDEFFVPDKVAIEGVKGLTKFDFSGANHWTTNTGWIKAAGTESADTILAQWLPRATDFVPVVKTTTTRVGTTVHAITDMPHGLFLNDLVWILGYPTTQAQAVFFTNPWQATSGLFYARTTPRLVTAIVSDTAFDYSCDDTGDTAFPNVTNSVMRASDVMVVPPMTQAADGSWPIKPGDTVFIKSDAYRQNGTEQQKIGEFQKVARILSNKWILLHSEVQDSYWHQDTARFSVVTFQKNFRIENIEVIGKGPHPTTYGDRGIWPVFCENPEIVNCIFTDVDQMGVHMSSCLGGRVSGSLITFNASNEAGSSTGILQIQYGIAYSGANTGLQITNNTIFGGRHAIVQSGGNALWGVARGITISGNTLHGQWLGAISSHQAVDNLIISGNTMIGVETGTDIRFGKNVIITGNTIESFNYGIYHHQVYGNAKVTNNTLRGKNLGIYFGNTAAIGTVRDSEPNGPVDISGNTIFGGNRGVYIVQLAGTSVASSGGRFHVNNNIFNGTKWETVRIDYGDDTVATDGFVGSVNGNIMYDLGQYPAGWVSFYITNMQGGTISNNTWYATTTVGITTQLIYLDGLGMGDGTIAIMGNQMPPAFSATSSIVVNVDRQVLTDMKLVNVSSYTFTIGLGVAKPRIVSGFLILDTQGAAATDDLDTLTVPPGLRLGHRMVLRNVTSGRTVVVKHNTGNIRCRGAVDRSLASIDDKCELIWTGTRWEEI